MKKKDPKVIFKEYCKTNEMRYTPERDIVIEEIYRKYEHFDIDSLFLRIRKSHPKIKLAKGSIYRTIPHLLKAGLIRLSFTDNGHSCYEKTLGHQHHDHMKCVDCGTVIDFYSKEIDRLQDTICKKLNFKMIWHVHMLGGYCSKCKSKKPRKQP